MSPFSRLSPFSRRLGLLRRSAFYFAVNIRLNEYGLVRFGSGQMDKLKVLFLCTGNSCRSQMAEGWARHLKGDLIEAYSAGVDPHGMNPLAVRVMSEVGVDLSGHHSKHVDTLLGVPFDYVVTVCDQANESCPVFPGEARRLHVGFDDPPRLARDAASEEEALPHYRRVRDEIRRFIEDIDRYIRPGASRQGQ